MNGYVSETNFSAEALKSKISFFYATLSELQVKQNKPLPTYISHVTKLICSPSVEDVKQMITFLGITIVSFLLYLIRFRISSPDWKTVKTSFRLYNFFNPPNSL